MALRIYGNRLLKTPPGQLSRPTLGRVREALFNMWQGEIEGCRWLDLCAGSGAMGAEALCRGASLVVGIEQAPAALRVIEENWQKVVKPEQTVRLMRGNIVKRLPQLAGEQFDRIYFDPPYQGNLYEPVLAAIAQHRLLAPEGCLAVEHHPGYALVLPKGLVSDRSKTYGSSQLTLCHWAEGHWAEPD